jgi:hypothetical protein
MYFFEIVEHEIVETKTLPMTNKEPNKLGI